MTERSGKNHANHGAFTPWRGNLRRRFILLSLAFSIAIVVLVGLSLAAFQGLSGARAYVHGESQWTKAQKQAVIALFDYAASAREERFEAFRRALSVNHGDRRARLTLSREQPDFDAAREGFLAGRNRPEDVETMVLLFVWGRSLQPFEQAIEAWTRADALIGELEVEARVLRSLVRRHGAASEPVLDHMDVIRDLDRRLTEQEQEFSNRMGQISDWMGRFFTATIVLTAVLLAGAGWFLARRLIHVSETRETALQESEQRYRALVDQTEVGMWQIDPHGRIIYFNPAMRSLLKIPEPMSLEGEPIERFVADRHLDRVRKNRQARERGENVAIEVELVPLVGEPRIALVHGAPIQVERSIVGHVGTCVDITSRKQAENELRFQALHDELTGLPNRKLFMDRLNMALKRARRTDRSTAVLFIDLDRFKIINDGLGHAAGDELLQQATGRLKAVIRDHDSIARFGGDEFGIVLENIDTADTARQPAARILEAFEKEFAIEGTSLRIGASIGIAIANQAEDDAAELLRQADIAMYLAKRRGGGHIHFYDPARDSFQQEHLHFESDLWNAPDRDELKLLYQPIVDLRTRRVESIEALVRWEHPEEGLLAPDRFIQLAEETGAILGIGRWVMRRACHDFSQLEARLGTDGPKSVAVNISDAEFRFGDPVSHLNDLCAETKVDPKTLEVEVTESMLTRQPEALRRLSKQGHRIAIDDFGTGYASLDRLRTVPFDTIKIDRSFIAALAHSEIDRNIIEAVIHVGRRQRVRVVAEGIETEQDSQALLDMGCTHGQGYLFSRPQSLEKLMKYLSAGPSGRW